MVQVAQMGVRGGGGGNSGNARKKTSFFHEGFPKYLPEKRKEDVFLPAGTHDSVVICKEKLNYDL